MEHYQNSFGYLSVHRALKLNHFREWPVLMGDTDENQPSPYMPHSPLPRAFDDKGH